MPQPPPAPIGDYAMVGDTETAALVSDRGSVDWLCLPRFDSPACFAALLGGEEHGRWQLAPASAPRAVRRRYRHRSLVLETEFETGEGAVRLVDAMPPRPAGMGATGNPDLVRVVEGVRGQVPMRMRLLPRFDYGSIAPWVSSRHGHLRAVGGPDALVLSTPVELETTGDGATAQFTVGARQRLPFVLTWYPSHEQIPDPVDADEALEATDRWWRQWMEDCTYQGPWADAVERSLLTLKALTHGPTGGLVAAATTSLPEHLGGVRNWDYRFVWLRDATFTLYALMLAGFRSEAVAWRDWLLRAVAGDPSKLQIMYGIDGRRRLTELELAWLPGYAGSRPVRTGNAAYDQLQLDVYGEVMDTLHYARRSGIEPEPAAWEVQRELMDWLESHWDEPDNGLWEVRGRRRHFTHSRLMAWVAFDRAVRAVERHGLDGPVERWRGMRDAVRDEVLRKGFDADRNAFVQSYGSPALDASLLMIPLVGFLPPDDPRVLGTIEAIERELVVDGYVLRYATDQTDDGLPAGEGAFLLTTFWLVDALALAGRHDEARSRFERLLDVRNDVGLMAEEYDPHHQRMLGNFPQAFSHVALINSACNLATGAGPSHDRREGSSAPSDR